MKIYHNPRCTKSRQTLALIEAAGIKPEIIKYLENIPSKEELLDLLMKLNLKPADILREGEVAYKEIIKGKSFGDEELIQIMIENPKLIERPIVVRGNKAVLGRPPENAEKLF
ncbi:arsenate reductase (glutaredoxin) [Vicingaceae bacterium]|nr:arsenate reductase (glutaredoxin) [Vicingaceae bacterium]MDB4082989.1 arsenate reductase (glutaredoxin) [Vicingaceae bacterium]MDB9963755.1 arsenate reductase (glutaredoxin) [Vicingaceae bacterium]MDC1450903.1 arsenate reductase (glutaredoxin) [Vicingaceae bacterium]